jgi:CheY-like chemotaxis protein
VARILIIDDDPVARAVLEQTLRSGAHEIVAATDGIEGVKEYLAKPADLVITDLFMPNRDGFETIAELRTRFPAVAIIAMSGNAIAPSMLPVARKMGAIEIVLKPFTPEEMLKVVDKVLGGESFGLRSAA